MWEKTFLDGHGREPTDVDRQDHLFSLIFPGSGPEAIWIAEDWSFYTAHKEALWTGEITWPEEEIPLNFDRFLLHLERLSDHYGNEQAQTSLFARVVGLVWGGIAYQGSAFLALTKAAAGHHLLQLHEGDKGWISEYVDDPNPAHHWAASFLTGFCYGRVVGVLTNSVRDIAQYVTGQGGTKSDILLGNVAARHGENLRRYSRHIGESSPYATMLTEMKHDLKERAHSP